MRNNNPLVTVIVPVWNREELIRRALDSVYEQYYRPIELLVVDDGSTDGTMAAVSEWANDRNTSDFLVRLIGRQHAGAPAARNAGIEEAKGKYIQFFDSDDILLPWKIAAQVEALRTSGADLAVCDFAYGDEGEHHLRVRRNAGPLKLRLAFGHSVFVATPLIDTRLLKRARVKWNVNLYRNQDMDFLFQVFAACKSYVYTPGVGTVYIHHSHAQISDNYTKTRPQIGQRVRTLAGLAFGAASRVTPLGRPMASMGAGYLVWSGVNHAVRSWLKAVLPKSVVDQIRRSADGRVRPSTTRRPGKDV